MIKDLVTRNRSYRRFHQEFEVGSDVLIELVDLARCSTYTESEQPFKYLLSSELEKNTMIFSHLKWAQLIKDWGGPVEGERPSAYIIILGHKEKGVLSQCDLGIAAQSIMMGATEKGLGGCIIGTINREDLSKHLNIPVGSDILLVIALGKPKEQVVIETVGSDGNTKYWRDNNNVHHVPKRTLNDIILKDS